MHTCCTERVKFAVTPPIQVGGPRFTSADLEAVMTAVGDDALIQMNTSLQLVVEIAEEKAEAAKQKLKEAGLRVYSVGNVVKNISTCSFCKGAEAEGLHTAIGLDERFAGQPVPSPLRVGYTGCTNGCGEPLTHDIGVVKNGETYDVYIGGEVKGLHARTGQLLAKGLSVPELYSLVENLIKLYQQEGKKREKFSAFVERPEIKGRIENII